MFASELSQSLPTFTRRDGHKLLSGEAIVGLFSIKLFPVPIVLIMGGLSRHSWTVAGSQLRLLMATTSQGQPGQTW